MKRLAELIAWVESRDELAVTQRRFIDGEMHKIIFGIPSCDWFRTGQTEARSCKDAWPASCGDFAQRNNDLPYEPCGAGLHGSWMHGVWVDRAPAYTGEQPPKVVAAMLRALVDRHAEQQA